MRHTKLEKLLATPLRQLIGKLEKLLGNIGLGTSMAGTRTIRFRSFPGA